MFSRACEYAIKIMIYIAGNEQEGRRTGVKEISEAINSPEAFSAKILQQLVKSELLVSYKGPTGGFELAPNKQIKLVDIVKAIDGNKLLESCVLGLETCSGKNPCPVHFKFIEIRDQLKETLLSTEIRDPELITKGIGMT
ncbi:MULTISPECIES: Rrf2 family transcriptional regulator [Ekhidna]|jgi:Rrf2 family iron-sulfur cluster assembly transcriptional regulator|uniref:Transcriptional regulator, BadM/Rrf2 family n=1 Tax=Ekhidna lutea TaxID=447679 RepID=A0A239LCH2_EKHLU|nr:Rrf2 family transcriptional regulator [Ekhidna lutea]SNT27618.1 transcriptional regulator, BadM/Rrf2 family [Ekhidna lutea]